MVKLLLNFCLSKKVLILGYFYYGSVSNSKCTYNVELNRQKEIYKILGYTKNPLVITLLIAENENLIRVMNYLTK